MHFVPRRLVKRHRHVIVRPKVSDAVRDEVALLSDVFRALARATAQLASLGQVKAPHIPDEAEALRNDWIAVGGDMRRAIDKVKHGSTAA